MVYIAFKDAGIQYALGYTVEDGHADTDNETENKDSDTDQLEATDLGLLEEHTGELVDVRVVFDERASEIGDEKRLVLQATAMDETDTLNVAPWAQSDDDDLAVITRWPALESPDPVEIHIRQAYVDTYRGSVWLELRKNVTEAAEDPGDNLTLHQFEQTDDTDETAATTDGGVQATEAEETDSGHGPPDDAEGRRVGTNDSQTH